MLALDGAGEEVIARVGRDTLCGRGLPPLSPRYGRHSSVRSCDHQGDRTGQWMTACGRIIDCHAHIIDPARFPFTAGPATSPRPDESGNARGVRAVLDAHGVAHGGAGAAERLRPDNRRHTRCDGVPGRFKAIAVIDPDDHRSRRSRTWRRPGSVGRAVQPGQLRPEALAGPLRRGCSARLKALGWFAQVYADDAQWPEAAPVLAGERRQGPRRSFRCARTRRGIGAAGLPAVLARPRQAARSSSSRRRSASRRPTGSPTSTVRRGAARRPSASDGCVWGSDWPFLDMAGGRSTPTASPPCALAAG